MIIIIIIFLFSRIIFIPTLASPTHLHIIIYNNIIIKCLVDGLAETGKVQKLVFRTSKTTPLLFLPELMDKVQIVF